MVGVIHEESASALFLTVNGNEIEANFFTLEGDFDFIDYLEKLLLYVPNHEVSNHWISLESTSLDALKLIVEKEIKFYREKDTKIFFRENEKKIYKYAILELLF